MRDPDLSREAPGPGAGPSGSALGTHPAQFCQISVGSGPLCGRTQLLVGSFESVINEGAGDSLAGHPEGFSLILF